MSIVRASKQNERLLMPDVLRVICCVFVVLYHLGVAGSGFLAVSVFFVLSGFQAAKSIFSRDFRPGKYLLGRFLRLYLPMFAAAGISILALSFMHGIVWISSKPESLSVFLCWNNVWQMINNSDYFAAAGFTPFKAYWYISLLIQYELVLPPVLLLIKKAKQKLRIAAVSVLTLSSLVYFFAATSLRGFEVSYYHPFARVYAVLAGVLLYLLTEDKILPKKIAYSDVIFGVLLVPVCIVMLLNIPGELYALAIALSTLAGMALVYFAYISRVRAVKAVSYLSGITYEVYLLHFPALFAANYVLGNAGLPALSAFAISVTLVLSVIIAAAVSARKTSGLVRKLLFIAVMAAAVAGFVIFIESPDHTKEMAKLEDQLADSQARLDVSRDEYIKNLEAESQRYSSSLEDLDAQIADIDNVVRNMPVVFIGDSVMLGASYRFDDCFNNYYCDALVSRPGEEALTLLSDLVPRGMVGDIVVIGLGANGGMSAEVMDGVREICGPDRKIFYLTVTNDHQYGVFINDTLRSYSDSHDNTYVIDWEVASYGCDWYFFDDGLHLYDIGRLAYSKFAFSNIKTVVLADLQSKRSALIAQNEDYLSRRLCFFGSDLLTDLFDDLSAAYPGAMFVSSRDMDFPALKAALTTQINDESVCAANAILCGSGFGLTGQQYGELISLLDGRSLYVFVTDADDEALLLEASENLHVIDCSKAFTYADYMADMVHFNEKGLERIKDTVILNLGTDRGQN